MRILLTAVFFTIAALPLSAQSFSCSIGKEAACLDYNDKVCSSFSKCVSQDASCFESYQCDYEGFACKSSVTECLGDYNALVQNFNVLLSDYDDLQESAKKVQSAKSNMEFCLQLADDLEEAKACQWY